MKDAPLVLKTHLEPHQKFESAKLREICRDLRDGNAPFDQMCGWYRFGYKGGLDELESWREKFEKIDLDYDCVIVVGVGGSFLGAKALSEILQEQLKKPIFFSGWHLSGVESQRFLKSQEGKKPLVVIISKSGTTIEPAIHFRGIHHWLRFRFKEDFQKRLIAITDPSAGALRAFANERNMLTFSVPPSIGGRYSVLSAVGMIPLMLAGLKVEKLITGADNFYENFQLGGREENSGEDSGEDSEEGLVQQYVSFRRACWDSGRQVECMIYNEPILESFVGWWQQLFGESEGKQHKGVLPLGSMITKDLHSLGQFYQDGTPIFYESFLTVGSTGLSEYFVEPLEGFADGYEAFQGSSIDQLNKIATDATIDAHLNTAQTPICEIQLKNLELQSLGYLLGFFMVSAAISGGLFGVNPFDQPGVEVYKDSMKALLQKV